MSNIWRVSGVLCVVFSLVLLAGCPRPTPPIEAITLSNTSYDFGLNPLPYNMTVWNNNPGIPQLTIQVSSNRSWLQVNVPQVVSAAPSPNGDLDQQSVIVSVNRTQLSIGTHEGRVIFSAPGIAPKSLNVTVRQDTASTGHNMNVVSPVYTYTEPYLVDMYFSLKDATGRSVVAEPAQFNLTAREGADPVDPELNGLQIQRAASRQLRANLVLDYSLNLQRVPGAIAGMENAARNIFLPALNVDAQVGVWQFHRDDRPPTQVASFTVDREFLRTRIARIQQDVVQGFFSGSRAWDAMLAAIQDFSTGNPQKESRYIVLFSDGNDTSSTATVNQVVNAARARDVRIYAAAFGNNVNITSLQDITARTGGLYLPTQNVAQIDEVFREIIHDLAGQYNVRWSSLKRSNTAFSPSFTLSLSLPGQTASVTHIAQQPFIPSQYAGDPLRGVLRLESSDNVTRTTVFLRAVYMPRFINHLRLRMSSPFSFTRQLVDIGSDGLIASWIMQPSTDPETGELVLDLHSPDGTPLQFASFGAMLRFEFDALENDPLELFDTFSADYDIYPNEQYFVVQGF